ncbi:MAG: LysM peptidoglycan-binding domain-containing protein [Clostridia bacterium]
MRIIFNELKERDENKLQQLFNVSKSQIELTKNGVAITILEVEQECSEKLYRMTKTDTLHSVSRRFFVPEGAILKANDGIIFDAGVVVVIPKVEKKRYTVKPLDSFSSIAKAFGTTVEKIKLENNIDYVYAGQIIFI